MADNQQRKRNWSRLAVNTYRFGYVVFFLFPTFFVFSLLRSFSFYAFLFNEIPKFLDYHIPVLFLNLMILFKSETFFFSSHYFSRNNVNWFFFQKMSNLIISLNIEPTNLIFSLILISPKLKSFQFTNKIAMMRF